MTPKQSSSGTYSGGEPKAEILDAAQASALLEWVRTLEEKVELHTTKRMMGTGSLQIRDGEEGARHFIIRNGQLRRDFDTFLEPFR